MLFIINLISLRVHFFVRIYSMYYYIHEIRDRSEKTRITFFRILLVTSNNLLLIFFGFFPARI